MQTATQKMIFIQNLIQIGHSYANSELRTELCSFRLRWKASLSNCHTCRLLINFIFTIIKIFYYQWWNALMKNNYLSQANIIKSAIGQGEPSNQNVIHLFFFEESNKARDLPECNPWFICGREKTNSKERQSCNLGIIYQ